MIMQAQPLHFWNHLQNYLTPMGANGAIICAIILLFITLALKSQILRQNRRFLRELKQELRQKTIHSTPNHATTDYLKASLIEQKIIVHQDLINLKAERMVELQSLGENGLSAQRYYHYFKSFRDLVINNRFYIGQESEFIFNQLIQDNATTLLKLKYLEHEFTELTNETPTDRYALEQLAEQEIIALEAFYQDSRAEMERFLEMVDNDVLALRAEIHS